MTTMPGTINESETYHGDKNVNEYDSRKSQGYEYSHKSGKYNGKNHDDYIKKKATI